MKNAVQRDMMQNRQSTAAMAVPRSGRIQSNSILLKMDPGLAVPVAAAGLLREDAIAAGRLNLQFHMAETAETIMNPVSVKVSCYLVPWLAFERFAGRDEFEASYSKKPVREGDKVIDFIETMARGDEGDQPVMDALGLHEGALIDVSSMYVEAYNQIINYRNKNLSLSLPERERLEATLAAAARDRGRHAHIVPTFDEAAMEGAVDINMVGAGGTYPVDGLGHWTIDPVSAGPQTMNVHDGTEDWDHYIGANTNKVYMETDATGQSLARVTIGGGSGIEMSFSLAAIERARQTKVFAEIRKRYSGLNDDAIINKLMDGIRMPDQMFEQPILLGSQTGHFGYATRYSSSSDSLDEMVSEGMAQISMEVATPRIGTGGVLMFIAEVQPEQMFERQTDPFLTITDVDEYPQFVRDFGDEQKVDIVRNKQIDAAHTDRDGVFGYVGTNDQFNVRAPRVGTGFFQPEPEVVFDEERARIWDPTPTDPALGEDWYLTDEITKDVFEYTEDEPFEVNGSLELMITGNTVFGRTLVESDGDYDAIDERIPTPEDQITQDE